MLGLVDYRHGRLNTHDMDTIDMINVAAENMITTPIPDAPV